MIIYHFVKYFYEGSFSLLEEKNISNGVLCFDLEDSIQDIFNPQINSSLKSNRRNLLRNTLGQGELFKTGVRINGFDTMEHAADMECLAAIGKVHTIFLPKVESENQIKALIRDLDSLGVQFEEIIPVIESKAGMNNLKSISGLHNSKIRNIAFGHCDYNLDCKNFPFFHQDSREYWSWIDKIVAIIRRHGLKFVNSPFLELNNMERFREMLSGLQSICGKDCGQVVLTFNQALACSQFTGPVNREFRKAKHRLQLKSAFSEAKNIKETFEAGNETKAFVITGESRTLISPQEYNAALKHLKRQEFPEFNFTFVGGCFPVQGSIAFEDRFHQLLKKNIENNYQINFNIQLLRYERIGDCLVKVIAHSNKYPANVLVFCIRPEPVLRLTKLFYRYKEESGKINMKLNFRRIKNSPAEKHDLLEMDYSMAISKSNSGIVHKILANLNYLLGMLAGNYRSVIQQYAGLVDGVINYCSDQNIPYLVMGPVIRTNRFMEKIISLRLERFMKRQSVIAKDKFIKGSDREKGNIKLFHRNGIFANEMYHELISRRIADKISPLLENEVEFPEKFNKQQEEMLDHV